ncbi:MAG: VOC family protein [Ginsengibacter sp.]
MSQEIWINLPVKDVKKSREFFRNIGFNINANHNTDGMAAISSGEGKAMVMLFPDATFESFTKNKIADTPLGTEAMFSFGADSQEEVDETAKKVKEAGGTVFAEPGDKDGWMYGFAFIDLDGHRWNMLYMDMSKMPK